MITQAGCTSKGYQADVISKFLQKALEDRYCALPALVAEMQKNLDGENDGGKPGLEDHNNVHVRYILEEILTLKCPGCRYDIVVIPALHLF